MLVLFETPAGYAIFKLLDEKKLSKADELFKDFQTAQKASKIVKLKHFAKFEDTTQALAAATALIEGKVSKDLKKVCIPGSNTEIWCGMFTFMVLLQLLKKVSKETQEQLLVADTKLGSAIKEAFDIPCLSNAPVQELMRGIRSQMNSLITGLPDKEMAAFALGTSYIINAACQFLMFCWCF